MTTDPELIYNQYDRDAIELRLGYAEVGPNIAERVPFTAQAQQGFIGLSAVALRELLATAKFGDVLWVSTGEPAHTVEPVSQFLNGELIIDRTSGGVTVNGEERYLPSKMFSILDIFSQNPGRYLSRASVYRVCWGYDISGSSRALDVHVNRVRKAIAPLGWMIRSKRNVGYMFTEDKPEGAS